MYGGQMIVTGAFLAESASVVDNKLNVQGGVIDKFPASAGRVVGVTLVVLTKPEPFDNEPVLELAVTGPNDVVHQVRLPVPAASLGGTVGFMIAPLRFTAPVDGNYSVSVGGQHSSTSMPLTVSS